MNRELEVNYLKNALKLVETICELINEKQITLAGSELNCLLGYLQGGIEAEENRE